MNILPEVAKVRELARKNVEPEPDFEKIREEIRKYFLNTNISIKEKFRDFQKLCFTSGKYNINNILTEQEIKSLFGEDDD